MSKVSFETFVDLVRRSGLVEEDQIAQALSAVFGTPDGSCPAGTSLPESDVLADRLLEAGALTRWQAERLLEGRYKGFWLGKYRLLDHLGRGGMSSVYLAEHSLMQRRVAIKILPKDRVEDSSYLARFYREAQAAARLDHRNIVRAYDVDNDNGLHYLVMEYIEGRDLQQTVRQDGPLDYVKAADFIRQASEGLAHAHEAGLIHRDIKPANLLVDSKQVVKLLDLGLARVTADQQASLTLAYDENVLGTADYLAPEQAIDSHSVDARADIYSLGCTLYYLLTGHPPFAEGTLPQRLMMHQKQPPPSILKDRPDAPQDLIDICMKMMAKKPAARYQSAREIARVLAKWCTAHGHPVEPEPGGSGIARRGGEPAAPTSPPPATQVPTAPRRLVAKPLPVQQPVVRAEANPSRPTTTRGRASKVIIPGDDEFGDIYGVRDDDRLNKPAGHDTVSNLQQQTVKGAAGSRPSEPRLGVPKGAPVHQSGSIPALDGNLFPQAPLPAPLPAWQEERRKSHGAKNWLANLGNRLDQMPGVPMGFWKVLFIGSLVLVLAIMVLIALYR